MAATSLEERVAAVETELAEIKLKFAEEYPKPQTADHGLTNGFSLSEGQPWWEKIFGAFKDDPEYDEAMRLGREWRDSFRSSSDDKD